MDITLKEALTFRKYIPFSKLPVVDDVFRQDCPARTVLNHVLSRWGVLVLTALHHEDLRFFELRDRIQGVSEKMLAQTLRTLVRDGLLHRDVNPVVPPQVSYGLAPLGVDLADKLGAINAWIQANTEEILAAQADYDATCTRVNRP